MSEAKLSEIIPKNRPFTFEGLDLRPSFRASDNGAHTYSINIMVKEDLWNKLKTIPRHRLIGGSLFWTDEDDASLDQRLEEREKEEAQNGKPKREPKAKKEKGPYGFYWAEMFGDEFYNNAELKSVLGVDLSAAMSDVKAGLYEIFSVTSMSFVSPERFEEWASTKHLTNLITTSRLAQKRMNDRKVVRQMA